MYLYQIASEKYAIICNIIFFSDDAAVATEATG